jgi:chromosome segregation ATPase
MYWQLDRLRSEVEASAERLAALRQSIIDNEQATAKNRNNQTLLLDSTVKGLSNLRRQQIEEIEKYYEENRKRLKADDSRISMEEERVSMERAGVAREEAALGEEKQEIEAAISSQTEEVQSDKVEMEMRLMGVSAEIRSLEKQLAEKRQQEKDLKKDLAVVEEKIDAVRKKYDRRLQRIHERVVDLTSDSEACRKEEDTIRQQRAEFEAEKKRVETTRDGVADWIDFIQLERDVTSSLRSTLEEVRATKTPESAAGNGAKADLNSLKEKVSLAEISLSNSMASLRAVQEGINALAAEDAEINDKIPLLESEKKAHAANKKFKEAAGVQNTLKTLQARREEIVQLLDASSQDTVKANSVVEAARTSLVDAQSGLKDAERDADMQQLDQLLTQSKTLRKAYRKAERLHEKKLANHDMEARLSTLALELLHGEVEVGNVLRIN